MGCIKRDIFDFFPKENSKKFSIDLDELEGINLSHVVKEERGVGRYIPYCNFIQHKGIITNGLVYLCQKKKCRYFRRYLEFGLGGERFFSTEGDPLLVSPYSRDSYRKRRK